MEKQIISDIANAPNHNEEFVKITEEKSEDIHIPEKFDIVEAKREFNKGCRNCLGFIVFLGTIIYGFINHDFTWTIVFICLMLIIAIIGSFMMYKKQLRFIESQGGMKVMYYPIIEDLLLHSNAVIEYCSMNMVIIKGGAISEISKYQWTIRLKHNYDELNVKLSGNKDGVPINRKWSFPVDMEKAKICSEIESVFTNLQLK